MSSEAGSEAEGGVSAAQTIDSPLDSAGGPQAEALSFYASRGQQSDCSPGASPGLEGQVAPPDCLTMHQDSRDSRRSELGPAKLQSATDYCEESLQEIDITSFLQTLCGHVRDFQESGEAHTSPFLLKESKTHKNQELLSLLKTQHTCEVHPDLHKIIQTPTCFHQDKFTEIGSQYFKTVPSSPHYFFYCPPSSKNESDTDLEVEYQDGGAGKSGEEEEEADDDKSLSDSNTVNQDDDDSFSILDGDSLLEPEATSQEMPPLFVHLTCSVNLKNCHGSKPIQTLPTCLAEVLSCLDNIEALQMVDLSELSVTLDIFVLTLPEIEAMADFHHNRYTSESSVSLNRSPGQPSSYRSDDELMCGLDDLRGTSVNGLLFCSVLLQIRWLLEDEIVSALRCSQAISSAVLQKVVDHVLGSSGHMCCQQETVPLQFVFGPEQSLEKFRQASAAPVHGGAEPNMSEFCDVCYAAHYGKRQWFQGEDLKPANTDGHLASGPSADVVKAAKQPSEGFHSQNSSIKSPTSPYLLSGPSNAEQSLEPSSPPKTPSTVSLTESVQSATHCYDGGSSESESESPPGDDQERKVLLMPNFWLIVRIHQDRVEVYSHSRSFTEDKEEPEKSSDLPEYLKLHQTMVRKISDISRVVNQRMLLQDLHDSHVCNSLLVAESEEDIWKNDSLYRQRHANSDDYTNEENYQPRDYLAATMEFIPGYFACDVVWNTVIHIHPRLKMGPNMGVSRAIQALRSVLNSFCVVNRKNMFVYQERTTKSVFYLRLCETQAGKLCDMEGNLYTSRSLGLSRSQEPSEELNYQRCMESSRPVALVDKHILLLVHGVGDAGE
ncbi:hypothetical protein CRUP_006820 [Coryphaenoides rupestris]|nr:hypothetical protein CRUP_006820 [Coryphaenoides rupestris]